MNAFHRCETDGFIEFNKIDENLMVNIYETRHQNVKGMDRRVSIWNRSYWMWRRFIVWQLQRSIRQQLRFVSKRANPRPLGRAELECAA